MRSFLILAAMTAIPAIAGAQGSRTGEEKASSSVPVSMMPPVGKCRIWMVGVAPAQQPAPTDCQTALRQRPTNGVVIFGPVEREQNSSAFRGRPNVEQGPEDRPRSSATQETSREARGSSREVREPSQPSREPATSPARERADTRTPASEPRTRPEPRTPTEPRTSEPRTPTRAEPASGTRRPTEDPPTRKPPTDGASTDNSAIIGALAAVMSSESTS